MEPLITIRKIKKLLSFLFFPTFFFIWRLSRMTLYDFPVVNEKRAIRQMSDGIPLIIFSQGLHQSYPII